jgi:cobalt-precorrin 5A hydrolase/precorrin-3B C17-methyltransferase
MGPLDAVFVAPAMVLNLDVFAGFDLAMTETPLGPVVATDPTGATNIPGLWAVGNVADAGSQVISASATGAKAGAMIGHDFCCISLSDLLTPWNAIEKRVKAAAEGDFVISFYNPRSQKRRDQLERAFAILKSHRPPDTPVIIASNLGRAEEDVRIVKFADFNPDDVDMLTLVMVGSSQSKSFARGDGRTYAYTPRGYAKKRETP